MPDSASGPTDGFAPIAIVWSMPEATVLVATLQAYGILALPRNQHHLSIAPPLMLALGGITVAVPPAQREDALALLQAIDTGWRCPPPPLAGNPWVSALLSVLMMVGLGVPPMPRRPGHYGWRTPSPEGSEAA